MINVIEHAKWKRGFWYLVSPYSKYPGGKEAAFEEVSRLGGQLFSEGVKLYAPIAHGHPLSKFGGVDPDSHDLWMPFDQLFMDVSVGLIIAEMDTWRDSKGIQIELDYFKAVYRPILYLNTKSLHLAREPHE